MVLAIILICIILLILLVSWGKVNPFVAFLIVAIAAGLMLGIPINKLMASVQKGMGDIMGKLLIIICLGAMLGKLVAVSGAAQKIAEVLVRAVGQKHIQWALVSAGFIIGIPLFYGIGFVLMVPLIFSVVYKYKLPAVYIGLPMLASLSVTHGFLPPHPSPSALVAMFHANMATTFIYGLMIAIPAIIIAGPLFARFLKKIPSEPLATFRADELPPEKLPGAVNSFLTALLPVILLMLSALFPYLGIKNAFVVKLIAFLGDPSIVMLVALLVATFTLGIKQGKKMGTLAGNYTDAVKDIALILLIIAGSGALSEVLTASGASDQIADQLKALNLPPLLLGWVIAAIIRVSLGSATVAGLAAAGILVKLVTKSHVDPNLMVLSIGAGSLAFSHVNDSGFWLFKEYFNISIKDTIRSWSVMETLVSLTGLAGVLIINQFVK
ncbi:gluconate:H+ symporter [Mucilaginibacter sp. AW1-7]|jgi:Gnt-I system high-affinity gluconate transporter|uniref:GntT/GntP/DsdX family permease n=1 Tax=unclassified Mucilaginibacter TaxID=2617802 RepID=UPI0023659EDE|nr:gluconate:H+ symporter [Mucilaginibacter sp. KACC 22773]WDF79309.1 gluconate:H+ symporter [Mucilaginibacter sp. KACC 22773]